VYGVLHKALEDALRLGHVQRNVSDAVTPPRRADQEMQVLTSDQAQVLLRTAEDHRLYALFVVAVTSGMRLGELLALQWRNVDLERKTLQVRATLSMRTSGHVGHDNNTFYRSKGRNAREGGSRQSTGDAGLFAPTKTKRSRRQIQLSAFAVEALHTHQLQQVTDRAVAGDAWRDLDLVFPNQVGLPLDPGNLRHRVLQPLLAKAGLPHIRFHDLRHTAATLLLEQGVNPKIVCDMLGHAGIGITLDVYSHAMPDIQQWAAAAMDTVFGRGEDNNAVEGTNPIHPREQA